MTWRLYVTGVLSMGCNISSTMRCRRALDSSSAIGEGASALRRPKHLVAVAVAVAVVNSA